MATLKRWRFGRSREQLDEGQASLLDETTDDINQLYDIKREVKNLHAAQRLQIRQAKSKPLADALHQWTLLQRQQASTRTATAKTGDDSLLSGLVKLPVQPFQYCIHWGLSGVQQLRKPRAWYLFIDSLQKTGQMRRQKFINENGQTLAAIQGIKRYVQDQPDIAGPEFV